ncbi:MAG: PSD1 and planctomycete cytochrome C domain-containing protein, partial [Flavobacteriaceae bacterium]|nr:PSD1 and planctomycete cytochrome C domain-containing protein [Flavobacteriaceae bacterium]
SEINLVDFNFDVKPILSDKCYTCHGPDDKARKANLRLDTENGFYKALEDNPNHFVIDKNNLVESEILKRISSKNSIYKMPPPESNLDLSDREKEILKKWVLQGGKWKKHWAYIKPELPIVPEVENINWTTNEIDYFILRKLESKGMSPSKIEEKEILLRRVYFDIIGLPPSILDIDNFISDKDPNAYEKIIDKLLESEAYGERMASIWMDLSRYGDSHGYQDDQERIMWPWRDWVIHAYNSNMPYDEFITWQMAGDMLPNATKEQILASGFNRNHKITQEGGVVPEEYRVEYVADRTVTSAKIMMGLTVECARCHTHKYDPITHDEFFSLYSFFNNVDEDGLIGYGITAPKPNLTINSYDVINELPFINLPDSLNDVTLMVMKETENLRNTYVLNRGSYDSPTKLVKPGTPEAVLKFDEEKYSPNRIGLSKWFFDKENPLTSRVTVNRIWQQFFGVGIVATPDDFGSQGNKPINPELLDWLAFTFQNNDNWNTKKFIKRIVMSSTYRQSSKIKKENLLIDSDNSYLANYPRQKLSAEMIRDNALATSGMLVQKVGGPSVKPIQPPGLWDEVTGGGGGSLAFYIPDTGENLNRRSLYTFWKRTVPPPSMMIFDAPTRDFCAPVRQKTSTPLQSLALMNDPQYQLAAENLSNNIYKEKTSINEKIVKVYRTITGRTPSIKEIDKLKNYLDEVSGLNSYEEKKAFNSLVVLVYNLDETTQKS